MPEVKSYALVKDGFVVNCVQWDAVDGIFDEFTTFDNSELNAAISDAYIDGELYVRPKDGYEYHFNPDDFSWTLTAESAAAKERDLAATNLDSAETEYSRATDNINALSEQIEDDDYTSGETAESVSASKDLWIDYRKKLRAYIKAGDGSASLPQEPSYM